ncbi:hypothetical protein XBI1_2810088 [Xenorhabdus bovienii str. Intermedium]|uniref:Uncharacterized protein n=1 Tax=Xenorhabdus bovienii str. Intermedium TaxID=1379677 RepID=A0A077QKC1_XENBV|nr:hypothetical protein XBI1_2810088 [Xenorhabdus bovienii str. Intermedium]
MLSVVGDYCTGLLIIIFNEIQFSYDLGKVSVTISAMAERTLRQVCFLHFAKMNCLLTFGRLSSRCSDVL